MGLNERWTEISIDKKGKLIRRCKMKDTAAQDSRIFDDVLDELIAGVELAQALLIVVRSGKN